MLKVCVLHFLFLSSAFADTAGDSQMLETVRTQASTLWSSSSGVAPQADFKICHDFTSCYADDCKSSADPKVNQQKVLARAASRPFVMPAQVAKNTKCKGVVLLVHGFASSPYSLGSISEDLSRSGYNVVTVLLSGHGDSYNTQSSCDGMTPDNWRSDVDKGAQLATKTFPGCPLIVGGHSTGGALAVDYLQRHQADKPPAIKAAADLLYDPALELPAKSEEVLNGQNGGAGWTDAFMAGYADLFKGASNPAPIDKDPARVPVAKDCAKALQVVNNSIRDYAKAKPPLTTPTRAMFSNGQTEPPPDKTIESAASQSLLSTGYNGVPGLFSPDSGLELPPIDWTSRHNTLTLKSNIGICAYKSSDVDTHFDDMMSKSIDFLDRRMSSPQQIGIGRVGGTQ